MAKVLDLNRYDRPVLELIMRDEEQTHIKVGMPTEELVAELTAVAPEIKAAMESEKEEATAAIYDLAARLINCNHSFIKVTPEDLRTKFHMHLESLIVFYEAYLDFISEVTKAKN